VDGLDVASQPRQTSTPSKPWKNVLGPTSYNFVQSNNLSRSIIFYTSSEVALRFAQQWNVSLVITLSLAIKSRIKTAPPTSSHSPQRSRSSYQIKGRQDWLSRALNTFGRHAPLRNTIRRASMNGSRHPVEDPPPPPVERDSYPLYHAQYLKITFSLREELALPFRQLYQVHTCHRTDKYCSMQ